jgi:DMSO/TMAO reductase YedYZ molybdopterin-dependent catalytic subunit
MKKGFKRKFMLIIIAILIIYLVNDYISDSGPIELDGVEIREYEGKRLSSVDDFRENSIKGPQYIDIDTYKLTVGGLVETPKEYAYEDVTAGFQSYKKVVTLDCVEGWSATILWEGILLKDLIAETQPTSEANTIIFYAHDGYSTSFPLDYVMNNDIILAHKMNDVTMPAERGYPFQLVAESKWGYKWIKWITRIELSDDPTYEGYWESRGYSNTGDLGESFRG